MKLNFSFNTSQYDLWEIYETIKKYYPIGLSHHEGKGIYFEYAGIKELEKIVVENIHDNKNWNERWVKFTEEIGKEINKEIIGTTYGQAPSFSSSVILERNQIENFHHQKELHFAVSLIGNFYQIYGFDITRILEKNRKGGYTSVNVVTTSPHEEFKLPFEFVEKKIKEKYPNHKIVPFSFGQLIIKGLQVRYLDDEECSVNQALFNQFLSEKNISVFTRGDKYYGIDKWKIKNQ